MQGTAQILALNIYHFHRHMLKQISSNVDVSLNPLRRLAGTSRLEATINQPSRKLPTTRPGVRKGAESRPSREEGDLIKSCIELLRPAAGLTNDHCIKIMCMLTFCVIESRSNGLHGTRARIRWVL